MTNAWTFAQKCFVRIVFENPSHSKLFETSICPLLTKVRDDSEAVRVLTRDGTLELFEMSGIEIMLAGPVT